MLRLMFAPLKLTPHHGDVDDQPSDTASHVDAPAEEAMKQESPGRDVADTPGGAGTVSVAAPPAPITAVCMTRVPGPDSP